MRQTIKHGAEVDFVTPDELHRALRGREQGHTGLFDVVVGNAFTQEPELLTNPPVRRLRVTRAGFGGEAIAIASGVASQILLANEGRLGLQITNRGAAPVFVYLCDLDDIQSSEQHSRPTLWLTAGGGSWDGTIGGVTWAGGICASGDGGATNLAIAEL